MQPNNLLLLPLLPLLLLLLLLVRPTQACPAQYNVCEAWTNISSFPIHSMVGVTQLEWADHQECRLLGLQTTYIPGIKYTFAVVSDYIVARKVYASAGQIIGSSRTGINTSPAAVAAVEAYKNQNDKSTKEHDHSSHAHRRRSRRRNLLTSDDIASGDTTASCFDCGRPTHGSVLFDWIAPDKGIGKVTFVALCGGSSQGNGAAGFVKISGHHSADETYAHSSSHTCVPSVVRALDEYALSGLQASDAAAVAAAAAAGGHASGGGGHSGTFSSFDALAGGSLSILFAGWEVSTTGGYVAVLLGCFAAGVAVRLLRIPLSQLAKGVQGVREDGDNDNVNVDNFCSKKNICSLVLLFLSFFVLQSLGYFLMLLTMLFDVGLFVSIMLGLSSGYVGETWWRRKQKSEAMTKMTEKVEKEGGGGGGGGGGGDVTTIEMKEKRRGKEEDEDSEVYGDCCDVDA